MPVKGFDRIEDQSIEAVEEMYGYWHQKRKKYVMASHQKIPYICDLSGVEYEVDWHTIKRDVLRERVARSRIRLISDQGLREKIIYDYNILKLDKQTVATRYKISEKILFEVLKESGIKRRGLCDNARIHKINENKFNKIETEEDAYFLGWMYSDGCISNGIISISLQNGDDKIVRMMRDYFFKENGPRFSIEKARSSNHKGQFGLKFAGKTICENLVKLKCFERKSNTVRFSDKIPENLEGDVIRGIFDGDGSITKSKRGVGFVGYMCRFFTVSRGFAEDISRILSKNGIKNQIYKECRGNYLDMYSVSVISRENVFKLFKFMYKESSLWLDRKFVKFIEFLCCRETQILDKTKRQKSGKFLGIINYVNCYSVIFESVCIKKFKNLADAIDFSNYYREKNMNRWGLEYKNWKNYADLEEELKPSRVLKDIGIYEKAISELPEIAELLS